MDNTISIQRRDFVWFQYGVITTFLPLTLLLYIYENIRGVDSFAYAFRVFDAGREGSLSTWFSSINLLLSALFLFCIFAASRKRSKERSLYWLILGVIFLALSIDEVAELHERSHKFFELLVMILPADIASPKFRESDFYHLLSFNWVTMGALFSIIVFIFFLPFLRNLSPRTAGLFLLAGALFVGGAVGFEAIGVWMNYQDIAQRGDFLFEVRRVFEEAGEMYGIAVFNCALFNVLSEGNRTLTMVLPH
ncbi:MAG: hypothetical protein OER92_09155 [Alphaproteobacteria bacterium]|nr:hypothetical protein [Alphaproteobacteria bacterium]